jgi:cold shock CspA family protein
MTKNFGIVTAYHPDRGYGFISESIDLPNGKFSVRYYFFHCNRILSGVPEVGASAYFIVAPGKPGKGPVAVDVDLVAPVARGGEDD